ncbi:MAG: Gfo/Idh/MocA family oxidoreductase [Candidatus Hydrogenedentes bacterium]|nr:Gfo/Idh/MocA family oxidoreductase [Candidatus Hydrogenedentota bacterium]
MKPIRLGFVGVGAMGQCAHLDNYATIPGCEIAAIADIRGDLAQKVATRYGVPHVFRTGREMLAAAALDGIVVTLPFECHGQVVPELYDYGVPVFTEKPLARSVAVGEKLLESLRRSRAKHVVGYHKRSDPATLYAIDQISSLKASGELGPLRYVRVLMPEGDWIAGGFSHMLASGQTAADMPVDPPPAHMDEATQERFDLFINYYIHQINLIRHLLGETFSVDYADPAGILMVGHSASGVTVTLEMTPYRTTVDWHEEALVAFERGTITLRLPAPLARNRPGAVTVFRDPGGSTPVSITPQLPWVHAMRQQAEFFVQYIRGAQTRLCEATEAIEDLRIAEDYIQKLGGQ